MDCNWAKLLTDSSIKSYFSILTVSSFVDSTEASYGLNPCFSYFFSLLFSVPEYFMILELPRNFLHSEENNFDCLARVTKQNSYATCITFVLNWPLNYCLFSGWKHGFRPGKNIDGFHSRTCPFAADIELIHGGNRETNLF